jgi:two-component system response regulator DevR
MRRFQVSTGHSSRGWEGLHVRIVVDHSVSQSLPGLADLLVESDAMAIFDRRISPDRMLETVARTRPDVVVVDPSWLVVSTLLSRCLVLGGCPDAVCVVGAAVSSDALRIQASRRGFAGVVDLGRPALDVVEQIRVVTRSESQLREDRRFTSIGGFARDQDMSNVTTDDTDREIIELLSVGLSDREIALGVHLSLQAVRNRVSSMLERSGCVNRTQLGWVFSNRSLVDLLMADIEPVDDQGAAVTRPRRRDGTLQ